MSNIIIENALPESTALVDTDLVRAVLSTGESKQILVSDFKSSFDPVEVALSITGATTIDLSLYNKWTNFKLTLIANATIVFTNMTAGQTGYVVVVQDGVSLYTLSYTGTDHGDTIAEPAIGTIDTHSFELSAIGTASAVEPIFGSKTNI